MTTEILYIPDDDGEVYAEPLGTYEEFMAGWGEVSSVAAPLPAPSAEVIGAWFDTYEAIKHSSPVPPTSE